MAGTYIEGVSKTLSGVYTLIKAALAGITLGQRGTVAIPFTASWGPVEEFQQIGSKTEFLNTFGNGSTVGQTGAKVAAHAWQGPDKPNIVLAYRMATDAVAYAQIVLNDTLAAAALTLKGKHKGTRANSFEATVAVNAVDGAKKDLKITEGGVLKATYTGATVQDIANAIAADGEALITATVADGKGAATLANAASAPFTGGNDGETLLAADYTAMLAALETQVFNTLALGTATTDETILASVESWVKDQRDQGKRITWVRGGGSGWDTTPADANTKSQAINYRGIINVGNGVDSYTAAEMAIYVAAVLASLPLTQSVADYKTPYLNVNKRLTNAQRISAKQAGTLVFVMDGEDVVIDEAVNTLTSPLSGESKEMGKIKVSLILDQVATDVEVFGKGWVGKKGNTANTRQAFALQIEEEYLGSLVRLELLQPGCWYREDPEYHGKTPIYSPAPDEAYFYADITPVDAMERIYSKFGVTF